MSLRPLPPDLEEIARTDLNEDPLRSVKDIQAIKEWLNKQPHLAARDGEHLGCQWSFTTSSNLNIFFLFITDDQWILTFLRGCKFSLERTKEKMDTYYTMRTLLPEFFHNRDPMRPEVQELLRLGYVKL